MNEEGPWRCRTDSSRPADDGRFQTTRRHRPVARKRIGDPFEKRVGHVVLDDDEDVEITRARTEVPEHSGTVDADTDERAIRGKPQIVGQRARRALEARIDARAHESSLTRR